MWFFGTPRQVSTNPEIPAIAGEFVEAKWSKRRARPALSDKSWILDFHLIFALFRVKSA